MHLVSKDGQGTLIYILGNGLVWAIVVVPTALIGQLFKSRKVYSPKMQMIRGGVLAAVGLIAFVLAVASQRATAPAAPKQAQDRTIYQWAEPTKSTRHGFQPWIER
jgi:hypothetical protein